MGRGGACVGGGDEGGSSNVIGDTVAGGDVGVDLVNGAGDGEGGCADRSVVKTLTALQAL